MIEKVAAQMVAEKVVMVDRAEELVNTYTSKHVDKYKGKQVL
jgi:hypothetical protein